MINFFRRHVVRNAGWKLASLTLAVGLWLVVSRDPPAEIALSVPIEFHHIPENLEIASESIPQAQVRIRGPERQLRGMRSNDVRVEVDLNGILEGEHTFDLTAQQVREPRNLEVIQVIPGQFRITLDTRLTKQVDVHPRVTGTFADGRQIARVEADPAAIMITGPRQRVAKVEAATTDPIDASGTMERAAFTTHAFVADPLVQVVKPGPIRVTIVMQKPTSPAGN
jgi:diadenylate cyclase